MIGMNVVTSLIFLNIFKQLPQTIYQFIANSSVFEPISPSHVKSIPVND